jgi:D-glutamate cyclase
MIDLLTAIRDLIQVDVNRRGLAATPAPNLFTECAGDFAAACCSLADSGSGSVAIVTGFFIPHGRPPAAETDGPLGAVFLARALAPLGMRITLLAEASCTPALDAGLDACGLKGSVTVIALPAGPDEWPTFIQETWLPFTRRDDKIHLIALERVGPSHTAASIERQSGGAAVAEFLSEVPAASHDRCHTMRGVDITALTAPAHLLFELADANDGIVTIGIGDGGNEIGMGKLPWHVVRHNIPSGARIACRIATQHAIVAGISNWGAYGLGAGVLHLRGAAELDGLFDLAAERRVLAAMVERGPLVDGVTGEQGIAVDGLEFDRYAEPLAAIGRLLSEGNKSPSANAN